MRVTCVLCSQEFKGSDRVTRCPNSITGYHTTLIVVTMESVSRSQKRKRSKREAEDRLCAT